MDGQTINFQSERKITVAHPFGIFNIELTNHCPMKCVMCPRTHHMTREQGFMDIEIFKKIIDELAEANPSFHHNHNRVVWLHHFGESLLHPQFETCIKYAAHKGIYTGLSINPMMLNDKTASSLISSGLHILYLSLDGHDDESFFKIRGINNMYTISRRRIYDFLNLKKENFSEMKIILSMIDFSLNDKSVSAVKDEWEFNKEINGFLLKNFTTWGGAIPEINDFAPESIKTKKGDCITVTCPFPWTNMTVTWDGDVVPCCFDYNKKFVIGNVRTNSLSYIWNDFPLQNLRNEFIENKVTNALCKNCDNLYSGNNSMVNL